VYKNQQLANVESFIQQLSPNPFTRKDIVWSVEEKIIFPKLKKGANFRF
jgi:hypothetical protein